VKKKALALRMSFLGASGENIMEEYLKKIKCPLGG